MQGKREHDEIRLRMFQRYLEGATQRDIGAEFGMAESTVSSIAKQMKWKERRERMESEGVKRILNRTAFERVKNIQMLQGAFAAVAKELRDDLLAGAGTGIPAKERIDKLVKLAEVIEKMSGGLSGEGAGVTIQGSNILLVFGEMAKRMSNAELEEGIAQAKTLLGMDGAQGATEEKTDEGSEEDADEAGILEPGEE